MERIVYNKTLDVHKAGVQFTLHGFETADKMARRIVISLMASGDAIDLQTELLDAVMYVTTPGIEEPSINSCTISGNTIIYDSLPITNEGITIMQLKLIGARPGGVDGVIATPRFAVEVVKSDVNDDVGESSPTYTAIEEAIARSREAYDSRLLRIALHTDCMFYAYFADGTVYESDVLKELFLKGDVLLSQSYAKGGTGIRDGEDTDNSKYYANVSKSIASEVKEAGENALEVLDEVKLHGVYTAFNINFESGEAEYVSPSFKFKVDLESGELKAEGQTYTFNDEIERVVLQWLEDNGWGSGFLPISGGTLTNNLTIQRDVLENSGIVLKNLYTNNHGAFIYEPDTRHVVIRNYQDYTKNVHLVLGHDDEDVKRILSLWHHTDINRGYAIFGEHNAAEYGIPQIVTGSYDGTGTFGIDNPNRLEFTGKPMMVIINNVVFSRGNDTSIYHVAGRDFTASEYKLNVTFGDNYISWYIKTPNNYECPIEPNAERQLNDGSYNYLAFILK